MAIANVFLTELEHEAPLTRKTLERVPDDKLDFKPHQKSFSMADLATHLTELAQWGVDVLTQDVFDLDPKNFKREPAKSRQELLELWDKKLTAMKEALHGKDDAHMSANWKLLKSKSSPLTSTGIPVTKTLPTGMSLMPRQPRIRGNTTVRFLSAV